MENGMKNISSSVEIGCRIWKSRLEENVRWKGDWDYELVYERQM